MLDVEDIKRIADLEFSDIIRFTIYIGRKLRIYFIDKSYLDVHISEKVLNRFAFHYERRHIDKTI